MIRFLALLPLAPSEPTPPPVDPEEARRRMHEELTKGKYDDSPSFVQWILDQINEWLNELISNIGKGHEGSLAIAIGLGLALIIVAFLLLRRTGLIRRTAQLRADIALRAEPRASAGELRVRAERALEMERFDDAVVLAVRSLVRDLQVRTVIDVPDGMTAHEAAQAAAAAYPDLRRRLSRAADAFDTAAYSRRSASRKQTEDVLRVAEYIAQTSPRFTAPPADEPSGALPAPTVGPTGNDRSHGPVVPGAQP